MMRKTALAASAAALLALALGPAPTAAKDSPAKDAPSKPGHQCFWSRNVTGFAAADEHILNVQVSVRDVYQFEMFGRCPEIDWNQRLALVSRTSSFICDGMDAEVITHTAIGPQRCPVRSIRKLTPEEIAALPKRARP